MKKTFKLSLTATMIAVATLGVFNMVNLEKAQTIFLSLNNLESLARGELPEIEITCGSAESSGQCWSGFCEPFYTPFGFAKAWVCDTPTGSPSDVCVDGAPC